jgi:hypothetical protein
MVKYLKLLSFNFFSKKLMLLSVVLLLAQGCVSLPVGLGMPDPGDTILSFDDCGDGAPLVDYAGISWDEGWVASDITVSDNHIKANPESYPIVAASKFDTGHGPYDRLGWNFSSRVVFTGAWISGAGIFWGSPSSPATRVELIGYIDGVQTFSFELRNLPDYNGYTYVMRPVEVNWPGVDRVEVIPYDYYGGAGYFAMDDMTYRDSGTPGAHAGGVQSAYWPFDKHYSAHEGYEIVLDAGLSFDPDGDSLEYRWDIGEDGVWDTGWSGEPTLSHIFTSPSSFVVEVTDGVNTDWDRAIVDIIESTPEAGFAWSPDPPQPDVEIQFTDTSTSYPDEIVEWSWDFGDGATSTEQNPVHV